MIVSGVADLVERCRLPWRPVVAAAIVWVAALGTLTWFQVGYWRDSVTLFRHTLLVAPNNLVIHYNLGHALGQQGHHDEALELAPNDPDVRVNLGLMLTRAGKLNEAAEQLNEAVRLNPNSPEAQNNFGLVLLVRGDAAQSIPHFSNALRLRPDFKLAQDNLNRAQTQLKNQQ